MKHTKRVILVMLVCLLSMGSQAQNFRGGLRAGFTATQMSGDDLSGFHKMGAYAGGFVNWRFIRNPHWAIQPEINFVMKGSSTFLRADKNGNIGNKYVLTLYYIEVPALAKYMIINGLEVEFGPTFGILCAATEKDANGKMPHLLHVKRTLRHQSALRADCHPGTSKRRLSQPAVSHPQAVQHRNRI